MSRSLSGRTTNPNAKRPSMQKRASVSHGEGMWLKQAKARERRMSLKREQSQRGSLLSRSLHSQRNLNLSNSNRASVRSLLALGVTRHSHGPLNLSRSGRFLNLSRSGSGSGREVHGDGEGASSPSTPEREMGATAGILSDRSIKDDPFSVPRPSSIVCSEDDPSSASPLNKEGRADDGKVLVASGSGEHGNVEMSFIGGSGATVAAAAAAAASVDDDENDKDVTAFLDSLEDEGGESATFADHVATRVTFSSCSVQYYNTSLGVNPFVSSGPPLTLAWDCDPSATDRDIPVDTFESCRSHLRRSGWDLILSRAERERRLLDAGCTRDAIANGVREVMKVKHRRRRTVLNLKVSGAEEFVEGWSRAVTKGIGMRKSSHSLYNEWIRSGGTAAAAPELPKTGDSLPNPLEAAEGCAGAYEALVERAGAEGQTQTSSEDGGGAMITRNVSLRKQGSERPAGPAFGISHLCTGSLRAELLLDGNGGGGGNEVGREDEEKEKTGDEGTDVIEKGGHAAGQEQRPAESSAPSPMKPFAIVGLIHPGSPASEAGLRRGDRIAKFGGVSADNHRNLKAVTEVGRAAAAAERSVPMTVFRREQVREAEAAADDSEGDREGAGETSVELTIRPRAWSGAGHLGFLLRRC